MSGKIIRIEGRQRVEDIVFTGGIDSLAGLYHNRSIQVTCITCAYEWYPAKWVLKERLRNRQQKFDHEKRWKTAFYKAVELDDRNEAARLLEKERAHLFTQMGIRRAYYTLKKEDRSSLIFMASFMVLCLSLVAGLLFGFAT
ncbi:hypothetical protein [uncultured Fibrella sp.]|uniref:hypothetical protein n=1 Tax=uncultured Fibrella sp. TaxID=1284596 RepID=UPI0035CACBBC